MNKCIVKALYGGRDTYPLGGKNLLLLSVCLLPDLQLAIKAVDYGLCFWPMAAGSILVDERLQGLELRLIDCIPGEILKQARRFTGMSVSRKARPMSLDGLWIILINARP